MAALPEIVSKAWDDHNGPVVLTTVDADGVPNAIYATCVKKFSEDKLVVVDNFFSKTRANIQAGSRATLLFITNEGKAYQVKGAIDYFTDGEIFDDMKGWNGDRPGHAAAVVNVEEVFNGADKLL
jgi:predicted pyridoxine 5'-phosphate oxidase superfamily flavin-nucleotide-binding protein